MERGYLIAALAIIATFTGFSRGFQSIEQWSLLHLRHIGAIGKAECHARSQAMATLKTHLRPHYAEKAELLAEMNVPVAEAQSSIAEQVSQDTDAARCARATAMQEIERARRDMLRMQRDMAPASIGEPMTPLSLQVPTPPNFEKDIRQNTKAAARLAARQLQIAADQLNAAANKSTRSPQ
jgi:hypothetical protein